MWTRPSYVDDDYDDDDYDDDDGHDDVVGTIRSPAQDKLFALLGQTWRRTSLCCIRGPHSQLLSLHTQAPGGANVSDPAGAALPGAVHSPREFFQEPNPFRRRGHP